MGRVLVARAVPVPEFPILTRAPVARVAEAHGRPVIAPIEIRRRCPHDADLYAIGILACSAFLNVVFDAMGAKACTVRTEGSCLRIDDARSTPSASRIRCGEGQGPFVDTDRAYAIDACVGDPEDFDARCIIDPAGIDVLEAMDDLMDPRSSGIWVEDPVRRIHDTGTGPYTPRIQCLQGVRSVQNAIGTCTIDLAVLAVEDFDALRINIPAFAIHRMDDGMGPWSGLCGKEFPFGRIHDPVPRPGP